MKNIVAIEIITTGIDPFSDAIIAIGAAVKIKDNENIQFFFKTVCPVPIFDNNAGPITVPESILKYADTTNAELAQAENSHSVMRAFMDFIPQDGIFISQNADLTRSFLQTATHDEFLKPIIDLKQLAGICMPLLPGYTADIILGHCGQPLSPRISVVEANCENSIQIWQCIIKETASWSDVLLHEINHLLSVQRALPIAEFFRRIASPEWRIKYAATDNKFSQPEEFIDLFPHIFSGTLPHREISKEDEWAPINQDEIENALGRNGAFAGKLPNYEFREQQLQMSSAIVDAFNNSTHLMVEAGTGIGKSLAYLIPSIIWAKTNNMPVIISTNTKNLQSQLFKKDLPSIQRALHIDFKAAIIKGRRNYLCFRKFFYLLNNSKTELSEEEQLAMVKVLVWATRTDNGDMSDSSIIEDIDTRSLAAQLSATADECPGGSCPHYRRCFLYYARAKALAADIVVANHSIVFSGMDSDDKGIILPRHAHIVFDEAHNIEDAATTWLSVESSQTRIRFILRRLFRQARHNKELGLLPNLQKVIQNDDSKQNSKICAEINKLAQNTETQIKNAQKSIELFFQTVSSSLLSDSGYSLRLKPECKVLPGWENVQSAQKSMLARLAQIAHSLNAITDLLDNDDFSIKNKPDFLQDINAVKVSLREYSDDTTFIMDASAEGYVFWVEHTSPGRGGARVLAAPISIGEQLANELYSKRSSIIFTSATMTVRGSYSFLKKRLGLNLLPEDRLTELNVGTVFDYQNQCIVIVPSFLPEPDDRERDYTTEVAELLTEVFHRTNGRALTLFTNYVMLRKVSRIIGEALTGSGMQVLTQGESGSRENITKLFKNDIGSVLMGTHSFWEGVDVVGETLSCLIMARLPFAVFTDPIIEARCEQVESEGGNAFMHYSVPNAVIKFRQGFGRLIRHRNDRGIIIVTDRRIISKRYGDWFRRSLPVPTRAIPDKDEFLNIITGFLNAD